MFRKNLFAVLLSLFAFAGAASAQKTWTLRECIDYALEHNIQIKQNKLNVATSRTRVEQGVASMFPSLNGSASNNYIYGRSIDPFTNQFVDNRTQSNNFSLNSQMVLFEGFQLQNQLRQARYDYIASKEDVEKMMNDVSVNVVTAYLQVLYNQELVQVSQGQLDGSKALLERTQKLVDVGTLPKGSLLDAEAQTANEEVRMVNAQNQLDISYLTLVQLLDLESTTDFKIQDPNLAIPQEKLVESTPTEIYNYAVGRLPEIKSAEYKLKSAEKGLAASYGAISPRLYLGGSIGTGYSDNRLRAIPGSSRYGFAPSGITSRGDTVYSPFHTQEYEQTPFRDQLNDNVNKSIGFSLSIPLFNGWQTKTSINRAKINMLNSKLSLQLAKNQLNKTIQQAVADGNAALKKYKATQKSVESLREAFKYTEQKYNVGLVSSFDFTTAKNNLSKSEADLLQAKYDYIFRTKIIDYYLGKPLAF